MKYYTSQIPHALAEKLKEKGMPMQVVPIAVKWKVGMASYATFASCFDWIMSRGLRIVIEPHWDFANEKITDMWDCDIVKVGAFSSQPKTTISQHDTWHEAAEKAIEKALTLI